MREFGGDQKIHLTRWLRQQAVQSNRLLGHNRFGAPRNRRAVVLATHTLSILGRRSTSCGSGAGRHLRRRSGAPCRSQLRGLAEGKGSPAARARPDEFSGHPATYQHIGPDYLYLRDRSAYHRRILWDCRTIRVYQVHVKIRRLLMAGRPRNWPPRGSMPPKG